MRMIVIKQSTDVAALTARLVGTGEAKSRKLADLQRLNPHVDFKRIEAGTVLLVPDRPGLAAGETAPVGGDAFDTLRAHVGAALDAAARRVEQGEETQAKERAEVTAVLKSAGVKRLVESDPDLKPRAAAALQVLKRDQERAKDAEKAIKILQEGGMHELESLAKRLA